MNIISITFLLLLFLAPLPGNSQNVVLAEDFNGGFPSNWVATETDGQTPNASLPFTFNSAWELVEDDSPTDSCIVTTSYFESEVPAERWLISPQLSLAGFGNFLDFKARSGDASFTDSILVLLSTTGNDPADFQDTLMQFNNIGVFWESLEVDLSAEGWNSQNVYLAIKVFSTDGYLLFLDNISVTTEDPASLGELNKSNIRIYPNPSTEMVTIKSEQMTDLIITDMSGKLMVKEANFSAFTVDVSGWPEGVYTVNLKDEATILRKKLIVK